MIIHVGLGPMEGRYLDYCCRFFYSTHLHPVTQLTLRKHWTLTMQCRTLYLNFRWVPYWHIVLL